MLATKPSTADSWYKYIDDSKNINNKDGYADGVKTVDYDAILKNLAAAKTTADQVAIWQSFLRDIANGTGVYAGQKDAVIKQAKTKYGAAFAQWMKDASIPTAIQDIYTNEPLAKLPDYMQGYLAVNPYDDTSKANYTTTLNNQLGTLTDSKGNKLLTPDYINKVASGNLGFFDDLTNKVDTVAYDAATKQLGTSAPNLSSAERASFIKDFLYNPDKINAVLHPADTGTKTDNTGTKTDNTGTKTDNTGIYTPSGLTSLVNPKLLDAQGKYRPYLSTWTAPKQGVASTNSPYSGLLDAMLNKVTGANYGTPETNKPYEALTSALTQGVGINSLPKPQVTYNANNPAGITGLGIDYTGRTLTPLNTQVTSGPSYNQNQIANAKTALENARDMVAQDTLTGGEKTDMLTGRRHGVYSNTPIDSGGVVRLPNGQVISRYGYGPDGYHDYLTEGVNLFNGQVLTDAEYNNIANSYVKSHGVPQPIDAGSNTEPSSTSITSANAGNGIATNTGSFTSAGNMNTNATGTNGASSIVSLLPNNPAENALSTAKANEVAARQDVQASYADPNRDPNDLSYQDVYNFTATPTLTSAQQATSAAENALNTAKANEVANRQVLQLSNADPYRDPNDLSYQDVYTHAGIGSLSNAAPTPVVASQPVQTTSAQPSYGVTLADGRTVMGKRVSFV